MSTHYTQVFIVVLLMIAINLEAITMSLSWRMDSPDNGILFRTNKK